MIHYKFVDVAFILVAFKVKDIIIERRIPSKFIKVKDIITKDIKRYKSYKI